MKKEAKWTKVRGTARVFEKDGKLCLRFPKSIINLFGLRSGDMVRFRKRHGKPPLPPTELAVLARKLESAPEQEAADKLVVARYGSPPSYIMTFWRDGRKLLPLKK